MKINTHLSIAAAMLILTNVALGQSNGPSQGAPKITINKTDYNFGEVKKGINATHTFVFKNEGTADLEIKNVAPTCGCTASDFTKVVPPGQEGKITLSVSTASFVGAVSKSADVFTNDPQREHLTLVMNMVVTADDGPQGRQIGPFIVGPSNQSTLRIPQGMSANGLITITNVSGQPIRITKVDSNGDAFGLTLNTLAEGARYSLSFASSVNLSIGSHKQTVKLLTDSTQLPELELQLEAIVTPAVSVNPTSLTFENLPLSDSETDISLVSKFLWVRLGRGMGLEVKDISSDLPFIKAKVESNQDGQSIVLRVGFSAKPPKGTHNGKLKIETNNSTMKVIEVPITVKAQ